MIRPDLCSSRTRHFRKIALAFAMAALLGGLAPEAHSGHCEWDYDPPIGQPGLSTAESGSSAYTFALYEGDLVAGGYFDSAGGQAVSNIARWDGTQWTPMGNGFSSTVGTLSWFRGSLYAFGQFQYAWPYSAWRAARWDGSSWQTLGADRGLRRPGDFQYGAASASIVYGDSLVVGGSFTRAGDQSVGLIAAWDGADWHPLGAGLDTLASVAGTCQSAYYPSIYALAEYQGDLIAGGSFKLTATGDTVQCIARWDGTGWHPMGGMGGGMGGETRDCAPPWVITLAVWNGNLIAGGFFETAGGVPAVRIARWDGTAWHPMGGGWSTAGGSAIFSLAVTQGNELIAAGFAQEGIINKWQVTQWNGTDWGQIGPDLTWISTPSANALFAWGPDLVVSGGFTGNVDSDVMNYVTMLRCNANVDVPASPAAPGGFGLRAAGPNPFFSSTAIAFDLPQSAEHLTLEVHDLAGRLVRTLHAGAAGAGEHIVPWRGGRDDGGSVPPGVYFARLRVGDEVRSLELVRLR